MTGSDDGVPAVIRYTADVAGWLKKYWWLFALLAWLTIQDRVEPLRSNYLLSSVAFVGLLLALMLIKRVVQRESKLK
jgi:hypothetical protein